ncbi:antirestriction protein ArdA [Pedobacter chitinilyticus]|uniref:Antirestriction protein ArdA n=1 Tax=Pedobacter chitinilyticus TaxID=2233776 RepID=A0A443YVZ8_9SPHI|nr:antirestriction protein ArdA [Pedobacter chitinilyticus]RWU08179.1 antirestriction protein ArdA [Pedobacter chitinilyticus]
MDTNIKIAQASIYVGTYFKYNSGSLQGKWMDLSEFSTKEEFYRAAYELHKDEQDPELMFQDMEHIPDSLASESWLSAKFFTVRDALEGLEEKLHEPFFMWCNNDHYDLSKEDIDELISSFADCYQGLYDSQEDFARQYVAEHHQLSEFSLNYFDYESYARDLFCESFWYDGGHVFTNS